jgi:hypothetical protein
MGGSPSKPQIDSVIPTVDLSKVAKVSLEEAQQAQTVLQESLEKARVAAATAAAEAGSAWGWVKLLGIFLLIVVVIVGALLGYEALAVKYNWPIIPGFLESAEKAIDNLSIFKASHGQTDVTSTVARMVSDGTLIINPQISKSLSTNLGAELTTGDPFTITYQFSSDSSPLTYTTTDDSSQIVISPSNKPGTTSSGTPSTVSSASKSTTVPYFTSMFKKLTSGSGSSGDLLGSIHDATTSSSIPSTSAPLSVEDRGAYGMQWWMFVKDWNYGYGKEKSVVKRPDTANQSILNPNISLHPTDNTLRISISIFPETEGGASSSQPAPAGHSGTSDDVYVCEVPNIPLQTWFSVAVTVFGRNVDVYIDGKLVKSCFLNGVPKPAAGDIQLTSNGGFSGNVCNFTHYSRMLTPADAMTFYSAGTSCQAATQPSVTSKATGYSVKFGVYDTLGKQIQQYTF